MTYYKTMQIWVKKGHRMHGYFQEMCQNAKNMHNTTNFYIRQVLLALTQEKELQPLQEEVLDTIQRHLPGINDNQLQLIKRKWKRRIQNQLKNQKEIKCQFVR